MNNFSLVSKDKRFWIGIGISLFFLYLAFQSIEFDKFFKALKEINYLYLIPVTVCNIFTYVIRAWRWKYFFKHIKQIRFSSLFSAVVIGFMANNILPARIGELVRAYCIGKKEDISKSMSFATIVLERIFDGFSLLFLFGVILFFCPFPQEITRISHIVIGIYLFATVMLISMWIGKQSVIKLVEFLCTKLPNRLGKGIVEHTHSFISGFNVLKNGQEIALIFFYSLILWTVSAISFYCMFLGCNIHLPFFAAVFVLIVIAIGISIPSSPGFIGTFQYFAVLGLAVFGIDKNTALTYSLVLHISQWIVTIVIGWIYLYRERISFSDIKNM